MSQTKQLGFINFIPYPRGFLRRLVRSPLVFYQLGLGDLLRPLRLMALTTQGRRTGLARHTVLECRQHGSKLYVVSGWGKQTHWVKNLQANPHVTIQYGQKEIAAQGTIVTDVAESLRALYMFQRTGGVYEAILANMSRTESIDLRTLKQVAGEFTVVRFDLTNNPISISGLRPQNRAIPLLIFGAIFAIISWLIWTVWSQTDE